MESALSNITGGGAANNGATVTIGTPRKAAPVPAATADSGAVDNEAVKKMVKEIQKTVDSMGVDLHFSTYGENQDNIAIAITDRSTGKVIREIPSKELQSLHNRMNELAGMIFNNKA